MKEFRCSAITPDGVQCRANADLTHTQIMTAKSKNLELPDKVLVFLCPRHFIWTAAMRKELGLDKEIPA